MEEKRQQAAALHMMPARHGRWPELQGETCEADAGGVDFVADVEADQQRGDGLDDAGVFEFSAVEGTGTGDFFREFAGHALRFVIIAADEDVAIDRFIFRQQFSAEVVKGGGDRDGCGN